MANDLAEITRALSAPLGEVIAAVGRGVAEAQQALDLHTLETFKAVYQSGEGTYAEFRLLGYQPTWYRIPEVTAEIYVTLSASGRERLERQPPPPAPLAGTPGAIREAPPATPPSPPAAISETPASRPPAEVAALSDGDAGGRIRLYATPVDASYSNTYGYDIRACSQIKFRIVPVPPATQAEGIKVVPKLEGSTYSRAAETLRQLGIPYEVADPGRAPGANDTVEKTLPEAGSIMLADQPVTLTLAQAKPPAPPSTS